MKVTEIVPPTNGGTLFAGYAVSTRGRRYSFGCTAAGEVFGTFREDAAHPLPDGRTFWLQVRAPSALRDAVAAAMHRKDTDRTPEFVS